MWKYFGKIIWAEEKFFCVIHIPDITSVKATIFNDAF